MKAIILSAGQGKRLLPLTAECPKCMLRIGGRSLIEWQIDTLFAVGLDRASVVVGYRADQVERLLSQRYGAGRITLIDNPKFAETDNLVSCWIAREEMSEDFVLLNGDTLVEVAAVRRVMENAVHPVNVVITHKPRYDADDMKVTLDGQRLIDIGKDLAPEKTDGESVGMIFFRGEGPDLFREGLQKAMADPSSTRKWYLSVIRDLCPTMKVWTCSIEGLQSCEVDFPADLKSAEQMVSGWSCLEGPLAKCCG